MASTASVNCWKPPRRKGCCRCNTTRSPAVISSRATTGEHEMGSGVTVFLVLAGLAGAPNAVSISAIPAANAEAKAENTLVTQADEAMDAKNWQAAEAPLQKLVGMNPGRWEYRQSLGKAQLNLGKYQEALGSFESALKAAEKASDSKGKYRNAIAIMLTDEGDVYLKLKRDKDAIAAFSKAAEMSTNPAVAWF